MPKKQPTTKEENDPVKAEETSEDIVNQEAKPQASRAARDERPKPSQFKGDYLLTVRLVGTDEPTIMRLLLVPATFTFGTLHDVLQIVFGWANCHAHSFTVSRVPKEESDETNPLHGHRKTLFTLQPSNTLDIDTEFDIRDEDEYTLADLYDSETYPDGVDVSYTYDHGDSWEHSIEFLGRADRNLRRAASIPSDLTVACLGGEGHPCAEDCGGPGGWEHLKSLFKKRGDPEGLKAWYKTDCANGEKKGLDPWSWNMFTVNGTLSEYEW